MILVTGATGYTGRFLMRRLIGRGEPLRCLVRPGSDRSGLDQWGVEVCTGDLERPEEIRPFFSGVESILHLAHVRYAPAIVACADPEVEQVVAVSSLRRFSRVPSPSVREVLEGEECLSRAGIPCTILRPSMIYGPGDDRNISRMAAFLRRYRWFPVFGDGQALQQPVYVEDVVSGILSALQSKEALGKCYALAGAEPLTYDQLIDAVGAAVGVRPVKVHIPVRLALGVLRLLARVGIRAGIDREQVLRLQEDKAFSIEPARNELGYAPLGFSEGLARIYGKAGEA